MTNPAEKSESLTGRALWIMSAKTLAFVFSFALPLLLVRRLDRYEFGLYKQVFLVVGTAVAVLPLGFAMSAFYFLPREPERRRQVVLNILLFNTTVGALACLALVVRPSLLAAIFRGSELTALAPLIGVVILLWIVSSFLEFIAIAHQESKLATVFIIIAQLTKTTLLLAAALVAPTVQTLVYAAVIQGALQSIILLVYLRSRFRGFWRSFEWPMMRRQLAYAVPLGLAGVLYTIQLDLHNYVVSYRFDAATFAVYSIGCFQLPLVAILSDSIGSVMIPRVSFLQKQNEQREIVMLTTRVMRKLAAIYFPLYALLLVVGLEFITVMFTTRYLDSWPIFAINLTMLPLSILILDPIVRAYAGQRHFIVKLHATLLVVLLAALWFATQRFGLVGAIASVVAVNFIGRLATAIKMARVVGVERGDVWLLKDVGKIALATLMAAAVTWLVRGALAGVKPFFVLAACGALFSLVYVAAILLLGVPTFEERDAVRRRFARVRHAFQRRAVEPLPTGEGSNV